MARPGMSAGRDKMRSSLQKGTEDSYRRKDGSGQFKTYFDDVKMDGVPKFNPGKGTWIIDIIPYEVGENDPHNNPGDYAYVLDVLVHMGIGPADERIVCPAQFNRPCPICEKVKELNNSGADYKTEIKPLVAKRRTIYNVIVRENHEEEKKGVQVMEMAHFFLEKNIAALSKNPRKGGYIVFSDPDVGKSISFRRTGVGAENTAYDAYQFVDRPEVISDAELEGARCLDDLISIRDYDDILSIISAHKPKQEEEEAPAPPSRSTSRRNIHKEEEHQDEQQEEEKQQEEEAPTPPPRSAKAGTKLKCPVKGGVFGDSLDEFEECNECSLYDACEKEMAAGK